MTEAREAASLSVGTTTAKQILRRSLYTGTEGYPAIIPDKLFAEVQAELEKRTHAPTRKKEPPIPVRSTFRLADLPQSNPTRGMESDLLRAIEVLYTCIVPDKNGGGGMTREEKKQASAYLASATQVGFSRRRVS